MTNEPGSHTNEPGPLRGAVARADTGGVTLRPAIASDAAPIAAIGARSFDATFAHTCTQQDMDDYLAANFTPAIIAAELQDATKAYHVACVDGAVAAFVVLNTASSEECVAHIAAAERVEVQRVYADPAVQGRGVARVLMEGVVEIMREMGFRYAWLGVWEHNVRATRFYEKFGFSRVGEHEFWLGNECQLDYIFAREL